MSPLKIAETPQSFNEIHKCGDFDLYTKTTMNDTVALIKSNFFHHKTRYYRPNTMIQSINAYILKGHHSLRLSHYHHSWLREQKFQDALFAPQQIEHLVFSPSANLLCR